MNREIFDEFLQESTLTIHDIWTKFGGEELSPDQLYELNDCLTEFFSRRNRHEAVT